MPDSIQTVFLSYSRFPCINCCQYWSLPLAQASLLYKDSLIASPFSAQSLLMQQSLKNMYESISFTSYMLKCFLSNLVLSIFLHVDSYMLLSDGHSSTYHFKIIIIIIVFVVVVIIDIMILLFIILYLG